MRKTGSRKSHVLQQRSLCAPTVLEVNQSRIAKVGAAQIKFLQATFLRFPDGIPKQKGNGSPMVITRIRAAVFIDQRAPVGERQYTGDSLPVLRSYPNIKPVA